VYQERLEVAALLRLQKTVAVSNNELLLENAAGLMLVGVYTSILVGGITVGLGTACGVLKLGR
jgi:hypothetical protein